MYNPQDIIDLIAGNVKKTRNPFGVSSSSLNTWWKSTSGRARRPGSALLFTGLMYQAIPYIEATTKYLERLEGTRWANYLRFGRFGRYIPDFLIGQLFSSLTSSADKLQFNSILQCIYRLLNNSGVDFFYHPEIDYYSGILLYDLGDQESFVEHAQFVARNLKLHGVEKIITVDPHTTYALKELYPKYTGIQFDVQPYFALLRARTVNSGNGHPSMIIHDPCFYGRYLKLSEGPRRLLRNLKIPYVDIRNCSEFTSCCGGPAESVSPALNREILGRRTEELKQSGAPVVTFCPICLANLLKAGLPVEDLAAVLDRHWQG